MKKNIIFGLFDVLIDKNNNKTYLYDYLEPMSIFCKNNNKNMFLITGLKEEISNKIVKKHTLTNFFNTNNIINITKEYEDSLSELDKKIKLEKHQDNDLYVDNYFKVFFLKNQYLHKINETLYVGSDIWTDGYYLKRYVNLDFIIIEDFLKSNSKEVQKDVFFDIHILNPSFDNLKKYLTEDIKYNYNSLESYAKKYLQSEILGKNFNIFSNKNIRDFVVKNVSKKKK
jgi:hypothetical protein